MIHSGVLSFGSIEVSSPKLSGEIRRNPTSPYGGPETDPSVQQGPKTALASSVHANINTQVAVPRFKGADPYFGDRKLATPRIYALPSKIKNLLFQVLGASDCICYWKKDRQMELASHMALFWEG